MTIKYVKDFDFPAKAGYTKSAARKPVKMANGGPAGMQEAPRQRQMMKPMEPVEVRMRRAAAQRGLGAGQQRNTRPTLQQLADGLAQRRAMTARGLSLDQLAQRGAAGMPQRYGQLGALAAEQPYGDAPEQPIDPYEATGERSPVMNDHVDAGYYKDGGPSRPLSLEEKLAMVVMDHEAQQFDDGGPALQGLRDQEGALINIQDDAADEINRVEERTPYDAQESEDKHAQLARVGAREENAHEELHRDRDEAVMMGAQEGGPKKDWIKGAIKKPGALRKYTDTAAGKSIPKGKLNKLAAGKPGTKGGPKPAAKTIKRAGLAKTLGKMTTKKAAKGGSTMKNQGYNDKLDESLGSRNGRNSQSMKSRRNESKGMEKSMGKRAYSAVDTMDMAKGGSTNKLAAVNRSTALKGFKQMGVMKRG